MVHRIPDQTVEPLLVDPMGELQDRMHAGSALLYRGNVDEARKVYEPLFVEQAPMSISLLFAAGVESMTIRPVRLKEKYPAARSTPAHTLLMSEVCLGYADCLAADPTGDQSHFWQARQLYQLVGENDYSLYMSLLNEPVPGDPGLAVRAICQTARAESHLCTAFKTRSLPGTEFERIGKLDEWVGRMRDNAGDTYQPSLLEAHKLLKMALIEYLLMSTRREIDRSVETVGNLATEIKEPGPATTLRLALMEYLVTGTDREIVRSAGTIRILGTELKGMVPLGRATDSVDQQAGAVLRECVDFLDQADQRPS